MAHVVLLRAANVAGHNVFSPKRLAADLADLEVTNIGAAGTFVVAGKTNKSALETRILDALDIAPEIAIVTGKAWTGFMTEASPVVEAPPDPNAKAEVTVLLAATTRVQTDALPDTWPATGRWEIRRAHVRPPFVFTWRRPGGRLQPYKEIAKALDIPATTRSWGICQRVQKALDAP